MMTRVIEEMVMADIVCVEHLMADAPFSPWVPDGLDGDLYKRARAIEVPVGYTALWLAMSDKKLAGAHLVTDEGDDVVSVTDETFAYMQSGDKFMTREVRVDTDAAYNRRYRNIREEQGLAKNDGLKFVGVELTGLQAGLQGLFVFNKEGGLAFRRFSNVKKVYAFRSRFTQTVEQVVQQGRRTSVKVIEEPYVSVASIAGSHRPLTRFNNELIRYDT
jgi:hypothetical protein